MNTQQKTEQYRQWLQGIVENTDGDTATVMKVVLQKFDELFPEEGQLVISDDHALQVMVDMDKADDTDRIYPR